MTAPRDWERELAQCAQDRVEMRRERKVIEDERDAALSRIAELEKDKLANDTSWAACQADRAELQAQVAEAQATLRKVLDWVDQTRPMCGAGCRAMMPESLWTRISKALSTDAGRALAERVAVLEEVAEAARALLHNMSFAEGSDADLLDGALARLDGLR